MKRALWAYKISGVKTSIQFLGKIMDHPIFRSGKYNTHFIDDNIKALTVRPACDKRCEDIAAMTVFIDYLSKLPGQKITEPALEETSAWKGFGRKQSMIRL
jgi:acetyl-CoA carboxylase biotin carboxylase subunit